MFIVVFCSLIALLLTFLESRGGLKHGMLIGFVLVTILGAIHYDYGNDYMSYYNIYKKNTSYTFNLKQIIDDGKVYGVEPGWILLNWLFKPIGGFFTMVAVLNAIQNAIVYSFIKKNISKVWWPLSISVYLFSTTFYLLAFSMMRQELVVITFLGLWPLIRNKRWYFVLPIIYLLSYIHTSALILLPFAFWGLLPVKQAKILGVVYASIFLIFWFNQDLVNNILMMSMNNEDLASYVEGYGKSKSALTYGVGYIVNLIPLFLCLYYLMKNKTQRESDKKHLVALALISFLLAPFSAVIQLIERISIYFGVYSIGSIPIVYGNIANKMLRRSLVTLYLLMLIYNYINFFGSDTWAKKYTTFHTIFSQL